MISEELQAQLRAQYNPDGSTLRKHQLVMLEMLIFFDDICKKHNIKYWLSSGTCLGAVRHGGFIPWDDDLDVEMLREDYLKLEKVFKETDLYVLQTYKNDPYYVVPFAKLRNKKTRIVEHGQDSRYKYRGIYIDVFVLEKSPQKIVEFYNKVAWKLLMFGAKPTLGRFGKFIFFVGKSLFYNSISITRFLLRGMKNNQLHHTYGSGFSWNHRKIEWIFPLSKASFEGYEFPVPYDCDSYLKTMYKKYKELPNLSTIQSHAVDVEL